LSGTRLWSGGEKPAGFSRFLRRELSGKGNHSTAATRSTQRFQPLPPCPPEAVSLSCSPRSRPSPLLKGKPPEPGKWRKAGSRRPLFRERPPLGKGEVTRKFAYTPPSKAGLCPWPRVTATDCGKWCSRKYFPESWKTCRKSASALRAVRKERHPAQSFAQEPPEPCGSPGVSFASLRQLTTR